MLPAAVKPCRRRSLSLPVTPVQPRASAADVRAWRRLSLAERCSPRHSPDLLRLARHEADPGVASPSALRRYVEWVPASFHPLPEGVEAELGVPAMHVHKAPRSASPSLSSESDEDTFNDFADDSDSHLKLAPLYPLTVPSPLPRWVSAPVLSPGPAPGRPVGVSGPPTANGGGSKPPIAEKRL